MSGVGVGGSKQAYKHMCTQTTKDPDRLAQWRSSGVLRGFTVETNTYVCMNVCMYVCMYVYMYVCMYSMYVTVKHMYVCMYVCMYVDAFPSLG